MKKRSKNKEKVTYTLYVDKTETPEDIQKKLLSRRIRVAAIMKGEVMAHWGEALGITRQAIYHCVKGYRRNPRIRAYIEERLGQKIWEEKDA